MTSPPARSGPASDDPAPANVLRVAAGHDLVAVRCVRRGDRRGAVAGPGDGARRGSPMGPRSLRLPPRRRHRRPEHDREHHPGARGGPPSLTHPAPPAAVVRVLVIGSLSWPRERAVEVRDAIAALARGHRRVLLVHAGRVCPSTGRLAGVDAWTELTATRLGLEVTRLGSAPTPTTGPPPRPATRCWSTPAPTWSSPSR